MIDDIINEILLEKFKDFKEDKDQSNRYIASEIRKKNAGAKITASTIGNCINGHSSPTIRTIDLINSHMRDFGHTFLQD